MKRRKFLIAGGMAAASAHAAVVKRELPQVDLSFISGKLDFHRRTEWTDQEVKSWRMRGVGEVDRLTIHHSGGTVSAQTEEDSVKNALQGILAGHTQKGYGDVGYHLMIDYAGRVWEGRSLAYEGAHVKNQNDQNIGVMLLGNFQNQAPSEKQLESMNVLIGLLRKQYRIKRHRIYGHRDLGSSACPGIQLYSYLKKIKEGKI
ncbi:hypothetical protein BVX97_03090 [bacterium E08(2017)]|nr:hypothetical protein BVX97_03090 [bacterium E08(2017)]